MKLEDIKANVGVCPECNHFSSFMETKKKNIYTCHICLKKVEQYINGKVIYKNNNNSWNRDRGII
jgi:hypothetical protein